MRTQLEYYFLLFFISAVLGWLMEVTCKLFEFRRFINRGMLIGPYCPIYGFGSVLLTAALSPISDQPVQAFLMAIALCGGLEYLTSYLLEKLFHARWWDYSKRRFNINGRVCANTLIPFGVLGLAMIYVVKPFLFGLFAQISQTALDIVCGALLALILTDAAVSTSILGKIRQAAENVAGDSTETITRAVRERLAEQSALARRVLAAFPYARIYNRRLLKQLHERGEAVRSEIRSRERAMLEEIERREERIHTEMKKIREQRRDAKKK